MSVLRSVLSRNNAIKRLSRSFFISIGKYDSRFMSQESSDVRVDMDDKSGIATLYMCKKPTNSLSISMLTNLNSSLEELEKNDRCRGVVITSSIPRMFCPGLELTEIHGVMHSQMRELMVKLNQLCTLLYGTHLISAAAINGHAVAGGCFLSLCCDHRVMTSDKALFGLSEVQLGFPASYWFVNLMAGIVGIRKAELILELGQLYSGEQAMSLGLVDEVTSQAECLSSARRSIAQYLTLPDDSRQLTKKMLRRPMLEQMLKITENDVDEFVSWVVGEECQERMTEYLENLKKKKPR